MISKISDINDEEESFCSNPSSSSFTSTIPFSICTRRTAATAAAAAYTNKFSPNVQSVGIWERNFEC